MTAPKSDPIGLFNSVPVVPVLVIEGLADAVPLARALIDGGLHVLEVTLRTREALAAVSAIQEALPRAVVGVGSVIEPRQLAAARAAGARFAVSPGATPALHAAALEASLPWLPGAQSVSEVLSLRALGYRLLKFFPAHASGGVNFLRAIRGPVPDVRFCPTGGISEATAPQYLAQPNVSCVGGSWLTPETLLAERNWDQIRELAEAACALSARTSTLTH